MKRWNAPALVLVAIGVLGVLDIVGIVILSTLGRDLSVLDEALVAIVTGLLGLASDSPRVT